MISMGVLLLLWLGFVHITGLYLFKSGFLLTRLALTDTTAPNGTLAPTHDRAIVLIIDALRFDFVSPDIPALASPYHHNVLTLPAELTARHPQNSFLFNSYADPPTTTLQRIKGITTGSLPTFVDLGNNFGGSSIAEDSLVKQLRNAGKTCAFMGDDTWMSVFPDSFHPNLTFPYDSFNVEDLHTVDNGVITHLFPLLEDKSKPFDFLVGHFLGVDHVGHRVGPDHPSMKSKLEQMQSVLARVVDLLDDDTLLVVLGDHGMDTSGDHGGDDILETSSALWVYSKDRPLSANAGPVLSGLTEHTTFPGTSVPHRRVQQIDLLPTLSLLLGLPIPFNNLGSVIPELFGSSLPRALSLNSAQIHNYLQTYRDSASGKELDDGWDKLQSAWEAISLANSHSEQWLVAHSNFNRVALSECRAMWAQFNPFMMGLGLTLLSIGILASWGLYSRLSRADHRWEDWAVQKLAMVIRGAAAGTTIGVFAFLLLEKWLRPHGIDALDMILFSAPFISCVLSLVTSPPELPDSLKAIPFVLILHALSFLSNSFTFWEDRIAPYLLLTTSLFPAVLTAVRAPTPRLRRRILGYGVAFAVCVRAMGYYTVCREEQQPYCHVTFYSSSTAPAHVRILILPLIVGVVYAIDKVFLGTSKSNGGMATPWINAILRPALFLGSLSWILEWVDTTGFWGDSEVVATVIRSTRSWFARLALGLLMFPGTLLWWREPMCIQVQRGEGQQTGRQQVKILGFGNAFGAPYLLFYTVFLIWIWFSSQLSAQIVLGLSTIAFLCYLEAADGIKDVHELEEAFETGRISGLIDKSGHKNSDTATSTLTESTEVAKPRIRFSDVMTISLLGLHTFYATGHQSTIPSIQWKSAFVLTANVTYPFSPLTVLFNSFGGLILVGVAAPLLAVWNREPRAVPVGNPRERSDAGVQTSPDTPANSTTSLSSPVNHEATLAALGVMIYFSVLLLGTAVSAAILRRHLMVWKVFAPRFMAAALGTLVVDFSAIIGVGVGLNRVAARVEEVFKDVVR
ncbi:mannose-ethanolamine phosphotransferase gpi13 [Marasmius sp. AFHP31]|nr:mannose-ethanolamine phosphotransferase gpi13 [Marasmius sp. AFHP31]KAK1236273.1 mannose-ethanolamine phosphotransferase gpi13 [Marasmius sp. AFHP31]